MVAFAKSMMRDRRAVAFARASERRRKLDRTLRGELAARRTELQSLEMLLEEKARQVELKTADVNCHAARVDTLTTGTEAFSLDELTAYHAYLEVAGAHLRALEIEEVRLHAAFDALAAVIEEKNLEIARNLARIDACDERIAQIRRDYEQAGDEALDEEIEETALARRMRNRETT
ncbi:type III secretion protein HrpB7 [Burkholderia thailandensis]|uniref:type III secretion protein HrpB7 n=1 Tax=Burkholderia thailandensis TaxID=57975 RepID=UPI002D783717|nr:type III secretion protein HrpB7 [Burkholderia thailandensis]WRS69982.1 type III secretion protein HrpB7 [Burkholderia thailandensis]